MARRKHSRSWLTLIALALVGGGLVLAFWPRPQLVDLGTVTRGPLTVTIEDEGRTLVRDTYVVSTPVTARVLRPEVHAGDAVVRGETVVVRLQATDPAALDIRTREQANALVKSAEAALRVAQADVNAAVAARDLAQADLDRTQTLADRGTISQAALDRARAQARSAEAQLDTTRAAVSMRIAELENAQAQLIGFDDRGLAEALDAQRARAVPIYAPASGQVLRVMQESEATLPAGTAILEIGDIDADLEVEADLVSTDAVQVSVGDAVRISGWGGNADLAGEVLRVAPFGTTEVSALGVKEQRVSVEIGLGSDRDARNGLGHGYRVEVAITVEDSPDALRLPAPALFRDAGGWAVFRVENGTALLTPVEIGLTNATLAEVTAGLTEGAKVVLFPSSTLADGSLVAPRMVE
ncbi:efflux RND transporter periplasmic adaptor subunit [Mesobacterium pallidum]|uniref:efflux RND transporter periplasmic adaptor subunit n=1 Tax=Mesobacterium pallidum TaxID=2872037 RepID=UPI001EE207FC|nr:HlyD family efflux transporter periplasmic adaptor subunit [Mesobacterium pallidum]